MKRKLFFFKKIQNYYICIFKYSITILACGVEDKGKHPMNKEIVSRKSTNNSHLYQQKTIGSGGCFCIGFGVVSFGGNDFKPRVFGHII
jgi:hypothetical protein